MINPELEESVLVVARTVIEPLCPQGFQSEVETARAAVLANCRFLERNLAEHDFRYKQVIPYVVIRHEDRYLLMRRTTKQTEARLHDKYSLGIGGHINDTDKSRGNGNLITCGMRRELAEEIQVEAELSCALVGVINDDSTEVSRVHMGFVYLLTTASSSYTIVEKDKYTAAWKSPAELAEYYIQMESWAQIAYEHVILSASQRTASLA